VIQCKGYGFRVAAGVLTIITANICLIVGIGGMHGHYKFRSYTDPQLEIWMMGTFGLLAFIFGLISGTLTLKGKRFLPAIFGICFMLLSGFMTVLVTMIERYIIPPIGRIIGITTINLAIISLIFTAISQKEFT